MSRAREEEERKIEENRKKYRAKSSVKFGERSETNTQGEIACTTAVYWERVGISVCMCKTAMVDTVYIHAFLVPISSINNILSSILIINPLRRVYTSSGKLGMNLFMKILRASSLPLSNIEN